ncbi:MAG TPA: proline--tRNA ligase, partial [Desulfuromonadales bacterium]|nr:proline--tRNA ligase [Desulfuromonadales bacterium]
SSHEFMVLADSGEDAIVSCNSCKYAANVEKAEARLQPAAVAAALPLERVATPDMKTIAEVASFLNVPVTATIKTMVFSSDTGEHVMALLRGDHDVNEIKLKNHLGWNEIQMASDETVQRITGSPAGFLGPIDVKEKVTVIADLVLQGITNVVIGANEKDFHYLNSNPGRDFTPDRYADIRSVVAGDCCPRCQHGMLEMWRGIEVGHVFKLGTKYSQAMNATYLDAAGKEQIIFMGCYGIGIGRTVAAAIEQNHDENGIIFPIPLAPFHCSVVALNPAKDKGVLAESEEIYFKLEKLGIEVLFDDRDERPGIKFKDNDLIGIPLRIVVGSKGLADGTVELKERSRGVVQVLPIEEAIIRVKQIVDDALFFE